MAFNQLPNTMVNYYKRTHTLLIFEFHYKPAINFSNIFRNNLFKYRFK